MNPVEWILEKRRGGEHDPEALAGWIQAVTRGEVEPYQVSAWLMAVCFQGMTPRELSALTRAMMESGDLVDLSSLEGVKVDKHSTGGVGDTTTLVLAPLAAAAGARVAKMSGRGLGHTGGTLDKLESIPGLRVDLSAEAFLDQVRRCGLAVISQTGNLVPADGLLYALRDVTGTVDSIPLIASSIMSKKLACGAEAILLDVKYGRGAFMQDLEAARELARAMVGLGRDLGRRVRAVITDMDQPLGGAVGNALEVAEAIAVLRGELEGSALEEVSLDLGAHLLHLAGLAADLQGARGRIEGLLRSGAGLAAFARMIEAQGGDPRVTEDPAGALPQAPLQAPFTAPRAGHVSALRAEEVGLAAMALGAGRQRKGDSVDPAVGIRIHARVGDRVEAGQPLFTLHARTPGTLDEGLRRLAGAVSLQDEPVSARRLIEGVVE